MSRFALLVLLIVALGSVKCLDISRILPILAPVEYKYNTSVLLLVDSMTSKVHPSTKLKYYDYRVCKPIPIEMKILDDPITQLVFGNEAYNTVFDIKMKVDSKSHVKLCTLKYNENDIKSIKKLADSRYHVNFVLNERLIGRTPITQKSTFDIRETTLYDKGFPLAFKLEKDVPSLAAKKGDYRINNHYEFKTYYYPNPDNSKKNRVVRFEIIPHNIPLKIGFIQWSYSVTWVKSDNYWQYDLLSAKDSAEDEDIHIIWVAVGLAITVCVHIVLVYMMHNRIKRQIEKIRGKHFESESNKFELVNTDMSTMEVDDSSVTEDSRAEELSAGNHDGRHSRKSKQPVNVDQVEIDISGSEEDKDHIFSGLDSENWQLLYGDVFRPPKYKILLAALVGNGFQLVGMLMFFPIIIILVAINSRYATSFVPILFIGYLASTFIQGFANTRLIKVWGKCEPDDSFIVQEEARCDVWSYKLVFSFILSTFAFPIFVVIVLVSMNLILQYENAIGSVDPTTIILLVVIFSLISIFLGILGSCTGYLSAVTYKPPCKVNAIARDQPKAWRWFFKLWFYRIIFLTMSFIVISFPLWGLLYGMWGQKFYTTLPLMFVSIVIWFEITCSSSAIIAALQLNHEHWSWRWTSYRTGTLAVIPVVSLTIAFYYFSVITGLSSTIIYFGYSLILWVYVFLTHGSVAWFSSYIYVHYMYKEIHKRD